MDIMEKAATYKQFEQSFYAIVINNCLELLMLFGWAIAGCLVDLNLNLLIIFLNRNRVRQFYEGVAGQAGRKRGQVGLWVPLEVNLILLIYYLYMSWEISQSENQYLYPFFLRFRDQMSLYTSGVFILDARAIYTPIESGYYGIVHVERLPIVKPPVYGLTDLTDCAIMYDGERILIFQGVFNTPFGYKFMHEDFQIKPITGLSFASPRIMVAVDETIVQREPPKEDDDEEDFVS